MNGLEFIRLLKETLDGEVAPSVIRENVRYYEDYIAEQVRSGKREKEVLEELGDPRLIARTIIETSAQAGEETSWFEREPDTIYEEDPYDRAPYEEQPEVHTHYVDLSKWYWKLAGGAVLAVILLLLFFLFKGILALLGPLLVIFLIITIFKNLRK